MKGLILIAIIMSSSLYAQKFSIKENSNNKKARIKVEFPEEYNLKGFDDNLELILHKQFIGIKYFEIKEINDLSMGFCNDTVNKNFNIYFYNKKNDKSKPHNWRNCHHGNFTEFLGHKHIL